MSYVSQIFVLYTLNLCNAVRRNAVIEKNAVIMQL